MAAAAQKPTAPYHHGDLRRALLSAASELIAEEQRWTFSLREIARRAGVSHAAPARHFADKRELLAALAVGGFETLTDRMRASSGGGPSDDLVAIGTAYVGFAVRNPTLYRLMFGPEIRGRDGAMPASVVDAADKAKDVLRNVVEGASGESAPASGVPREERLGIGVLAAWALVHGLSLLMIDDLLDVLQSEPAAVATRVTSVLRDGLKR